MPPEAGAAIGAGAGTLGCGACAGTFLVAGAAEAAGRAGAREGDEVRELAGRWKQTRDRKGHHEKYGSENKSRVLNVDGVISMQAKAEE